MFWNVFFEGAIYGCWLGQIFFSKFRSYTYVLKCTRIFFQIQYSKRMFWNEFLEGAIYLKFLVGDYFGCCFIFSRLLNSVAADLIKVFTASKIFAILTCINTNLRYITNCGLPWIKQTDKPGLCFENQHEALQISRNNCQLPGKNW